MKLTTATVLDLQCFKVCQKKLPGRVRLHVMPCPLTHMTHFRRYIVDLNHCTKTELSSSQILGFKITEAVLCPICSWAITNPKSLNIPLSLQFLGVL